MFVGVTAAYSARLLVGRLDDVTRARITQRWGRAICRACAIRVDVAGWPPTQAALLVANHRSYADITALAACLPVSFVAKAEVERWPVLGAAAARAGTVFLRRGDA